MIKFVSLCLAVLLSHPSEGYFNEMKQLGFQPYPTPKEIKEISLPTANGKTLSLKKTIKGKWAYLVFWATWCGPCNAEMPRLQAVYAKLKNKNFTVFGVSVDRGDSAQKVRHFIKQKGIKYPIVRDHMSFAMREYESSSVPTLFLISPDSKIVGIRKGGSRLPDQARLSLLTQILSHKKSADASTQTPQSQTQQKIIEPVPPPNAGLTLPEKPFYKGTERDIAVEIEIIDPIKQIYPGVPALTLDKDFFSLTGTRAESFQKNDRLISRYLYTLLPLQAGETKIGPITIKDITQTTYRIPASEVIISTHPLHRLWYLIPLLILLGAVLFYGRRWLKNRPTQVVKPVISKDQINKEFQLIQSQKPNLSRQEYGQRLLTFYLKLLKQRDDFKHGEIKNTLDQVSYGGFPLETDDILKWEKQVTQEITQI